MFDRSGAILTPGDLAGDCPGTLLRPGADQNGLYSGEQRKQGGHQCDDCDGQFRRHLT